MSVFDRLCNAQSETELFVLLCSLTRTPTRRPLRAELVCGHQPDGVALELTIRQAIKQRVAPKQVYVSWTVTHVFTLPANSALRWQMVDQPTLSGLAAIRAQLDRLRTALDPVLLADDGQLDHA